MTRSGPIHGHVDPRGREGFGARWLNLHYVWAVEMLSLVVIILNVLDYWTSAVALGRGFIEGNNLVVALSNLFGLQVLGGLVLTKIIGVAGGVTAAAVGIRVKTPRVRKTAMVVLAFLVFLLLAISINNILIICL